MITNFRKKNQLPVVTDQDIYVVLPEDTCEGDIYQPNEFGILVCILSNNVYIYIYIYIYSLFT